MAFAIVASVFQGNNVGAVQVYNSDTGALLRQQQFPGFVPNGLDFGPNGNLFVADNNNIDSFVFEFDDAPLNPIRLFADPEAGAATDLEFSPEGNLYVMGDTFIRIFNGQTGNSLGFFSVSLTFFPSGITFGPDGNLYASNSLNGTVVVINRFTGGIIQSIPGVSGTGDLTFDSNGNLFVISGSNVNFLTSSGRGTFISGFSNPRSLAFGPNGNLFVTDAGVNAIYEFNGTTGALVKTIPVQGTPNYITFASLAIGANPTPSPTPSPTLAPTPSPTPTPSLGNIVGTNGNDRLIGTSSNDNIFGLAGRDRLIGRGGNDTLIGGGGNDTLNGGSGSNLLRGEGGRDTFVLNKGTGRDRILDFQDGRDRLGLTGNLRFRDLDILRQGNNTLIRANGDLLALVEGVSANQIRANDFV